MGFGSLLRKISLKRRHSGRVTGVSNPKALGVANSHKAHSKRQSGHYAVKKRSG